MFYLFSYLLTMLKIGYLRFIFFALPLLFGGQQRYSLSTLPYGNAAAIGLPTWRIPEDNAAERHGRCSVIETSAGKRFELPPGESKVRACGLSTRVFNRGTCSQILR